MPPHELVDIALYQFPFPSGITCVDDVLAAAEKVTYDAELLGISGVRGALPVLTFLPCDPQLELLREQRQRGAPVVIPFCPDLHEVAKRPGDGIAAPFHVSVLARACSDNTRYFHCDGWFFCNDGNHFCDLLLVFCCRFLHVCLLLRRGALLVNQLPDVLLYGVVVVLDDMGNLFLLQLGDHPAEHLLAFLVGHGP